MNTLSATYTESEQKVIDAIKGMLPYQDQIFIGDLNGDPKQLRGVLASLVKKGAIDVNKKDGGLISLLID